MHASLTSPILKLLMADLRSPIFTLLTADFTVDAFCSHYFFLPYEFLSVLRQNSVTFTGSDFERTGTDICKSLLREPNDLL